MDSRKENSSNAKVRIQEAARQGIEQAGQFAKTTKKEWDDSEQPKRKRNIKRAVMIGILCLLIVTIGGLKGIASVACVCSGGWLIYCAIKKKPKKLPAILTVVFLAACAVLQESTHALSAVTQEYAVSHLAQTLDKKGWGIEKQGTSYIIYDKASGRPVPEGGYHFETDENGRVTRMFVVLVRVSDLYTSADGMDIMLAAMQMYDGSISKDKVLKILSETSLTDIYTYNGIAYQRSNLDSGGCSLCITP